ncbi:MAG: hypothetical protein WD749_06150 [Phycisphaerales bacterium]
MERRPESDGPGEPCDQTRNCWFTGATTVALVLGVAAAVRVLSHLNIPLVISNDGAWYLHWAHQLLSGESPDLPPFRTPGYPLFLWALFAVFGSGPGVILGAQHALGCATAALVAWMVVRLRGPVWGLAAGLLAALDPVLLAFESTVLTESVSTFLLVALAAMSVGPGSRQPVRPAALGLVLGALCLVRPAFQVFVPFLALGVALQARATVPRAIRLRSAAILLLAFGLVVGPWVYRNAQHGTRGLSGGNGVFLWIGVAQAGLLVPDFPLPGAIEERYRSIIATGRPDDGSIHRFLGAVNAWRSPGVDRLLGRWARASVRARPLGYSSAALHGVCWQLGLFPRSGSAVHNETTWMLRRFSQDGREGGMAAPNFQFNQPITGLDHFAQPKGRGPLAWTLDRLATPLSSGWPRLLLGALAVFATGAFARAGRWTLALCLAASLAHCLAHAAFLLPYSRYTLPCWVLWCIAVADIPAHRAGRSLPAHESPADGVTGSRPRTASGSS